MHIIRKLVIWDTHYSIRSFSTFHRLCKLLHRRGLVDHLHLISILFSPGICIFLERIHFHVHIRPDHQSVILFFTSASGQCPHRQCNAQHRYDSFFHSHSSPTLFSYAAGHCWHCRLHQIMPYSPWRCRLPFFPAYTDFRSCSPRYNPESGAMRVPSKTHRFLCPP